jgi:hypothetical protein
MAVKNQSVVNSDNVAAIDPWSDGKLCTPEDHWDLEKDGCALAYTSELLLNWPDSTPTVDLKAAKKLERLVAIILGYPRISRGMYPLDWPTHPESTKALKLSLYFDSIKCSRFSNWSLRTSVLVLYNYYKEQIPKAATASIKEWIFKISSMIFDSIRANEGKSALDVNNLTIGEMRFTSALHSSSGDAQEAWMVGKDKYKRLFSFVDSNIDLTKQKGAHEIRQSFKKTIHSVKVTKIQTWIKQLTKIDTDNYPMKPNLRQNMLAGCSTIIESIFAKLRHTIVKKYGASSILIDGGGRISFYSQKQSDLIKQEILHEVYTTFMIDDSYQHPFNNIIQRTVNEDAIKRNDSLRGRELFEKLIGVDVCKTFFPPISYTYGDDDSDGDSDGDDYIPHDDESDYGSDGDGNGDDYIPYCDNYCILCRPSLYQEEKELKYHTKDWQDTCFPHRLAYNIGLSAKRRDISWRSVGSTENFKPKSVTKIDSIAVFDLNSLGYMFKSEDDSFEGRIRRIRKSFRFNAIWWNVISNALNDNTVGFARLNCWIAAGDDITLVMRHGDQNTELIHILEKIDFNLKKSFKNYDVKFSFGAGLSKRATVGVEPKPEKILHTLRRAREAETEAKLHWKYRAKEYHSKLIEIEDPKTKKVKLKETRKIAGVKVLNENTIDTNLAHKSVVLSKAREEE